MASGPITSWQIDGAIDFTFGASKITVDGDCSHKIKRHLLLGRKVMTNLDSILRSRGISLSMGFPKQEYCSGLPFPFPGDLSNPRIKPVPLMSPALAGGFLPLAPPEKPQASVKCSFKLKHNRTNPGLFHTQEHRSIVPSFSLPELH